MTCQASSHSSKPYWLRAFEAGICMVFTAGLALPMPLLSIYIIDHVIANGQIQVLHLGLLRPCGSRRSWAWD